MTQSEGRANRRIWLLVGGAATLVVAAMVLLALWPEAPPPGRDQGPRRDAVSQPQDAAPAPAPDAALAPPDPYVQPDRPRPRPTRRISDPELRRLQRRHRPLLQACYARIARRDPQLSGRVDVVVELAAGGRVRAVRVDGRGSRELADCVRRVVRRWRFSPTLREQTIRFPLVLAGR